MKRPLLATLLGGFLLLAGFGTGLAQPVERPFVSFDDFLAGVEGAQLESYTLNKAARVREGSEFRKMRQHVLSMYQGVDVAHSFSLEGQIFDCVRIEQQPSLRDLDLDKALPVPPPPARVAGEPSAEKDSGLEAAASPLTLDLQDAFGNAVSCAEGSIPLRRITLEEMTRFRTLEGFFRKTPWSEGGPDEGLTPKAEAAHKYAHAYQTVKNYGGNSWLNLWSPRVNTGAGQVFSLSQQWYAGGRGAATQTVEGGWQVYPAKYRTDKAALFIYWTADNYNRTGCYNLDCRGFVQTNSRWALGGTWSNYSSRGGAQLSFQMQWKLSEGRWWLFLQGDSGYEAIGYYPVSIFRGGQLARFANVVDYGGETVATSSWPPMGSGVFPAAGAYRAAFQSGIFYIKTPTIVDGGVFTQLRVSQPSPRCYKLLYTPASQAGGQGPFFYFGGPGGNSC